MAHATPAATERGKCLGSTGAQPQPHGHAHALWHSLLSARLEPDGIRSQVVVARAVQRIQRIGLRDRGSRRRTPGAKI